jgi:hypothetical protein
MHPGNARLDHLLHQLECVEDPAEARLGIRHDGLEPVDGGVSFGVIDLIGAQQAIVDALGHGGHGIRRV